MNSKYFKRILKNTEDKDKEYNFLCYLAFYELIYLILCLPIIIWVLFCANLIEALIFFIIHAGFIIYVFYNNTIRITRKLNERINLFCPNGSPSESLELFLRKDALKNKDVSHVCIHELCHRKIFNLFKLKSRCFVDFYFEDIFFHPNNKIISFPKIRFLDFDAYCNNIEKETPYSKIIIILNEFFHFMFDIIVGGPFISYVLYCLKNYLGINEPQKKDVVYQLEF